MGMFDCYHPAPPLRPRRGNDCGKHWVTAVGRVTGGAWSTTEIQSVEETAG